MYYLNEVSRPPRRRALRLPQAAAPAHQLRGQAERATRSSRNTMDGAELRATVCPTRTTVDNARMSSHRPTAQPATDADVTSSSAASGLGVGPDRANGGGRRRGRLSRVHARPVEPAASSTLTAHPASRTSRAGSMGEGWSDWYAEDFLNNQGFKLGHSNRRRRRRAARILVRGDRPESTPMDCSGRRARHAAHVPRRRRHGPGGYTYGDFGKVFGSPEVHSDGEIWLQTALADPADAGRDHHRDARHACAGALPSGGLVLWTCVNAILPGGPGQLPRPGPARGRPVDGVFAEPVERRALRLDHGRRATSPRPRTSLSSPRTARPATCVTLTGKITDRHTGRPAKECRGRAWPG